MKAILSAVPGLLLLVAAGTAQATYVNFESSQVHPITLTPAGDRLLAVNTPDARLEVFSITSDGGLVSLASVPVGLEPVTVRARLNPITGREEAWVVNRLSDTVSIVDLDLPQKRVVQTLAAGDEPSDVVFAQGKAFVAVSQEDLVRVYSLANLGLPPQVVPLFGRKVRALAVSNDEARVYAVVQDSGNQTTVVDANVVFGNNPGLNNTRLTQLGLNTIACSSPPPPYPPLPPGITRNPALIDPPDGIPKVSLIVKQENICVGGPTPNTACRQHSQCGSGGVCGKWEDEIGQNWNACLPFRLPDHDLFIVDAVNPTTAPPQAVDHLGTTLFEVAVHPGNGKIYVPNTDARNFVRFEHPRGVQGHVVDNLLSVVDPGAGDAVVRVNLNTHIPRACSNNLALSCATDADCPLGGVCIRTSDPATNLAERAASISQPGMMVWNSAGTKGYLTAIGSRKVFEVDGACSSGSCIFGPNRALPGAVEVGEGPTGVALNEAKNRLYVLLRFPNSIAVVDSAGLTKVGEVPLHDPGPVVTRDGRRFLYDAIDTSGHGDAACSSCHISGDKDALAWDLGNPEGSLAPYSNANDNVRFIVPLGGNPTQCDPSICAAHQGFDPQKGPMTTQTLRAMLEPLHWRGDRPTMRSFNKAFVGLMGTADIGPVNGEPAGLTAAQMDLYRSFALAIRMPPNPFRRADNTFPGGCSNDATRFCSTNGDCVSPGTCTPNLRPYGSPFVGNPGNGEILFNTLGADAGQACAACHALPFGAAGGRLGGVEPAEPTPASATALFNGNADGSPHSDLEVPHLRNMYEKFGPTFGPPGTSSPPDSATGFGFIHDGAIPDLGTFLSASVFNLTAAQARDIATFMFFFPTGTRPAVGKQLTVPGGAPPTGTPAEEALLTTLLGLGNLADPNRHCELVAAAPGLTRLRTYVLNGGISTGGLWTTDAAGEAQVSTTDLRSGSAGQVMFLCVPMGEGMRLGANLDEDIRLNGDDCAPADAEAWAPATEVSNLAVAAGLPTHLAWDDQVPDTGPGVVYEAVGGDLSALRSAGLAAATGCLSGDLAVNSYDDTRPDPPVGDGYYYLTRARNGCATGGFGPGRASLDPLNCVAP